MDKKSLFCIFLLGIAFVVSAFLFFSVLLRTQLKIASYDLPQIITIMDDAGIVVGYLTGCFTIAAIIVGYIKRYDIKRWFFKSRFIGTGEEFSIDPNKIHAMVIPVSRPQQPEWILRHLKPKVAALVYTQQTKPVAEVLQKNFTDTEFIQTDQISNPHDPSDTKIEVKSCISKFKLKGIHPDNIFVDVTGGTVPMSIGAFMAAEEEGVSTIYVIGQKNGKIENPKDAGHGRPIYISNRSLSEEEQSS